MSYPLGITVTVNRITADPKGNRTVGDSHEIAGCALWPTSTKETIAPDQDVLTFSATLFVPPGSDILSTDEVVVAGVNYRVDGEPQLHQSTLTAMQAGIEVNLVSTDG